MSLFITLTTIMLTAVTVTATDHPNRGWEETYQVPHLYFTSASHVERLDGNTTSIRPRFSDKKVPGGSGAFYLIQSGPLGYAGPLGPYGPLGMLGPLNNAQWSSWSDMLGDWSDWTKSHNSVLGANGPLGESGPISDIYYNGELFMSNDFAVQLRAMGLWAPLGPLGPLGALGILGPLGVNGAHGYRKNANGEYIDKSNSVVRSVDVWFDADHTIQRTYDLYEMYQEDFAKKQHDLDTSFMVRGEIESYDEVDQYVITSKHNQIVTLTLVPDYQLDNFDMELHDIRGLVTASNSVSLIDWIQIKVPENSKLAIKVTCSHSGHPLRSTYRLFVTGSSQYINMTNIHGDHVGNWNV
eukprot:TRINITY_DN9878_c0_g1_i1.p1 TRINITY_DN9878_c0_g1~~TRINITY_DN9878_c0_g1_i1.p1  ORF type:complete len:366 (+),score=49.90 TRINITY_DN9878_c0_g1_i1:37-1098(+)